MSERPHLRSSLREGIRDMIVRQELLPGRSIGEVALSRKLGVSRTPVREALLALEQDGLVRSRHGRGFTVVPLTRQEAADTYPIIWSLERLAIETDGAPPP